MRLGFKVIAFLLLILIGVLLYVYGSDKTFIVDDVSKAQSFVEATGIGPDILTMNPELPVRVRGEVNGEGFIYVSSEIPTKKANPKFLGLTIKLSKGKIDFHGILSVNPGKTVINYVPVTITQGNLTIETAW